MGFDLIALQDAVATHGRVARVVVAGVAGSAPREVGAAMLVWDGGQSGTIGGGALELHAAKTALSNPGLTKHPLGPELGQCCGGAVTLLTEVFDAASCADLNTSDVVVRGPGEMPLAVRRVLDRARARGERPASQLIQNWLIEPVSQPTTQLWIWGAGHVGRALVDVISPLPDIGITWVDTAPSRFPEQVPPQVTVLPAAVPERVVAHAPKDAHHLILTFSHALDLAICDAVLRHGFGWAGLIGSDTKWARFRSRLRTLGHSDANISGIRCPIGQKSMGKHPQAIAVGFAADLLNANTKRGSDTWGTSFYSSTA